MILLLYKKISRLTKYMIQNQEIGKIINTLSSDFNLVEVKGFFVLSCLSSPIKTISVVILLVVQFGFMGIFPVLFLLCLIFFQVVLGKKNSEILREVNIQKDNRIRLYSEIVDSIKFIKYNGWEYIFQ